MRNPAKASIVSICVAILTLLLVRLSRGVSLQYHATLTSFRIPNYKGDLFLFSTDDKLCSSVTINKICAAREKNAANEWPVRKVQWETSGHVAHFKTHPEKYTQECLEFFYRVIK
jgi:hypothetical protein